MRHAIRILALAAALAPMGRPPAIADNAQRPDRINGIGLIDFYSKPTFKVGDWARYHMSAKSALGVIDDYSVTVLVAGEEQWWGEDCFWIETWTESEIGGTQAVASLMSYDVFRDSLALPHMQLYVRKLIQGIREDGTPEQSVYRRPASTLRTRDPLGSPFRLQVDTLGHETITVPKGSYDCLKLRMLQGRGQTGAKGDSTDYTELREQRTTFYNTKVPITHIVREDIQQSLTRRAWLVGHSQDATPTVYLDDTKGSAELVDCGSGLSARMVPERLRKSIAEQRATAKKAAPAKSAPAKKAG